MIELHYGNRQRFRYRHGDLNLIGRTHLGSPVVRSEYCLNGAAPIHFYVEPEPPHGGTGLSTRTGALIRLSDQPGAFNIEIPVTAKALREGTNQIEIRIQHAGEGTESLDAEFTWDSRPIPLPLSLGDLGGLTSIQDIGQAVDGKFEVDRHKHVIRTVEPVGADVLLLLGSPAASQEATYEVRFAATDGIFIGLSDFFAGHEPLTPELGIKPGYSSAGLATLRFPEGADAWLLNGALLDEKEPQAPNWMLKSFRPSRVRIRPTVTYRVRHQVIFAEDVNLVRFRIWPKGDPEPSRWLCEEHDAELHPDLPRFSHGSFGLFQYGGRPTEWSNVKVRSIEPDNRLLARLRRRRTPARKMLRTLRRNSFVDQRTVNVVARLKRRLATLAVITLTLVDVGPCLV